MQPERDKLVAFLRKVLSEGGTIRADYRTDNSVAYAAYSARLDAAARERADEWQGREGEAELVWPAPIVGPSVPVTMGPTVVRPVYPIQEEDGEADETPITADWLLSIGFGAIPSPVWPESNLDYKLGGLVLWEFNDTGDWLLRDMDSVGVRTRGQVRRLAAALSIPLADATAEAGRAT